MNDDPQLKRLLENFLHQQAQQTAENVRMLNKIY